MTRFLITTVSAVALAAASFGGAPAGAAPVEDETAADMIEQLESEGYKVIVSKFGTAPLDQCSVESLRSGTDVYDYVKPPTADEVVRQVQYTTIYLDARC